MVGPCSCNPIMSLHPQCPQPNHTEYASMHFHLGILLLDRWQYKQGNKGVQPLSEEGPNSASIVFPHTTRWSCMLRYRQPMPFLCYHQPMPFPRRWCIQCLGRTNPNYPSSGQSKMRGGQPLERPQNLVQHGANRHTQLGTSSCQRGSVPSAMAQPVRLPKRSANRGRSGSNAEQQATQNKYNGCGLQQGGKLERGVVR